MKKIIVAIDGYSSCGKSTMAKTLARKIGYTYIDSGAMYRAVTLFALETGIITGSDVDAPGLEKRLNEIKITFSTDKETGSNITELNGKDVERRIRTLEVSSHVSAIAALPFIRTFLTAQQRSLGKKKGIVMDGRDIGTTVFPDAELKIFVTASAEVRARRRYDELQAKGERASYEEIIENVKQRDYIDTHREVSPLTQASDAVVLDNSFMTLEQQDEWLMEQYRKAAGC